ncbi:MAG: ABC transporter ATP-binding protein/permease [Lachnospiraceae bacterium]|nr:ABC transporter ATP-binding protein/permease [Lachnospiraceae bacterium]MDE6990170.1 ABC transporter ATP-binding protein/permease [Lachnospiraceae bacterium]MDE6999509.1 ABC transporter ATP-binding protein/permease [Lachnospiraceae bacterium]
MTSTWKLFCRTMRVMGRRRFLYYGAILGMSVGMAMFSVLGSMMMKCVVDISQSRDYRSLGTAIAGIVSAGIVSLLIYRRSAVVYNVEAKRVYGILYERILDLEMDLPYAYYETHHSGDIMSKVSYDLGRMGDIYGSRFRRMIMPFLEVVVYLVPMLVLSPQLTLCLVGVNLAMMSVNMVLAEPLRRVSRELAGINSGMTRKLSDILQGMEQVRMFARGSETVQEYIQLSRRYAGKSGRRILLSSGLESANRGFDLLCALVFLALGVFFVQRGYTTLGALAAIYTLYGSFSAQFLQMNRYMPELVAYLAYAQNIFDLLEEEREPESWYTAEGAFGADRDADDTWMVSVDKIGFSYGENRVLENYSLAVQRGECVAITGASGCGKSTVSKLLLGLYPVDEGTIAVLGNTVGCMTNRELREHFAYVPQEPYLFEGSVRENIRMGKLDASEEEIVRAARMANAHEFIRKLEKGYDTQVGERGNRLSGGQRQRIAIARAILKGAPILLMDEATSALDNESERLVNCAMRRLHGHQTILMIAHRSSTIRMADRVCCFDQSACSPSIR